MEIDDREVGLHRDIQEGWIKRVRVHPNDGVDANAQGGFLGTLLSRRHDGKHRNSSLTFLDSGADVNLHKDRSSQSALFAATLNGSIDMVRMLLDNSGDINTRANGNIAFHVVSKGN